MNMPKEVKEGVVVRNRHGARWLVTQVHREGCEAEQIESPDAFRDVPIGARNWIDVRDLNPAAIWVEAEAPVSPALKGETR